MFKVNLGFKYRDIKKIHYLTHTVIQIENMIP